MARTSANGWDNESTATSCVVPIGKPDWSSDYFVKEDAAHNTLVKLVTASANDNLDETVRFEWKALESVSGRGLTRLYDPSTKPGFRFTITDSFIRETTDSVTNKINDDAIQVKIEFSAPNGANITSGKQVADMILHTLGFILEPTSAGTALDSTQKALDRLISGGTKPYQLV